MKKKTSAPAKSAPGPHSQHEAELPRLRRAKGQLEGVEKMILEGRYCPEIIQQIKAARSALLSLEVSILKNHLKSCVSESLKSKDAFDAEKKINEIADLLLK